MVRERRSSRGERESDAGSGGMAGRIVAGSGGAEGQRAPPVPLDVDSWRSRWPRLAWLPIPLLAAAIVVLWAADLPGYYESPFLLITFNLIFSTLASLFVAGLIARSFLIRGTPGLLLLGCGVLTWGAAGGLITVTASRWDINVLVTTHNLCVWLSALCHLAGAVLSLRTNRVLREAGLWLTAAYTIALGGIGLVTLLALAGYTPAFFVQGRGGTPLRSLLLGSATAMFVATALLLKTSGRKPLSAFLHWYTLALGLIAVGLFGVMIESVLGGPLSWTGRAAQFLGGAYLLISGIASVRESRVWGISLEETLHRERTFVAAVLETVGALVTVLDRQGRIVTFNRACEEATGYRFDEVQGRCLWEFLLTADELGPVQAAFTRLRAGEFPSEHENYWVARDGTRRLIHWTNSCLTDRSGAVEYVIGTGIDVTEQRRAEEGVRESEDRLRRIAQAGHIGLFEWNASQDTAYWSPEHYEIFGFDPRSAVTWDRWLATVHPDDRDRLTRNAAELREQARGGEQGRPHQDEYRIVREDGSVHWLESEITVTLVGDDVIVRGLVRDVSARKQAEVETGRMRLILSEGQRIAHVGSWEYLAATQETIWSEEECRIYGLDPAGPSPDYHDMLRNRIHPEDAARLDATFRQCLREHSVFELEHRIVRPDGSVRVLYDLAHPYFDEQGKLVKYIGATLDITERRQADAALRESEARLRAVLDNSPDAIFLKDRDSRLLLANPATFAIIGKPPEACLGKTDAEFYDDEATGRTIMENDRRIMESGRMEIVEETVSEPQGRRVYLSTKAPYRDADGRIIGLIGLARDITEHKRAEDALRESEARLRMQVERMPIGCLVHDEHNCFTHVNPAAERILGYSEAELRGQHVSVIVPEAARAHVDDILRRVAGGDMTAHSLNENVTKDGRIITCQWTNTPLRDAKGAFVGFLSMVQDVTEQKRAEDALRQSREDLSRAQEVGQIGWWRLDTRRNVLTWSDENHRIFGVPEGTSLAYETFLASVHPDDREYVGTQWNAGLRGAPYDIEHRIVAEGQVKWVREKAYLEFDEAGTLVGGFGITQDITQRKRAEEALQRLNEELEQRVAAQTAEIHRQSAYHRSLIEAGLDPLVTIGLDGKITDVNVAAERVTGRCRGELLGTDFSACFTEPDKAKSSYEQVFREGLVRDYPLEIRHADGRTTPVACNQSVYRTEAGEIAGVVAAARDISERRRAEQRLQAERQRFDDLLETLPVYVALLSPDYHMPFANRFFRERFGESHGRRCFEFLFERTEPCQNCETCQVLKTGAPHHWEWTGPDGRDYDVYDSPFVNTDGSTLILAVGIDVTERKKAQAALQAERQRLYEVLETLPAMICLFTPDYHVAFANRGFRERFGESHGRPCYEYCFGRTGPCEFCETYEVLTTGRSHHWEIANPDGRGVLDVYAFPFTDADGSPMILEISIDITERRQAEADARRMRDELARVDRVARMGELTASLAHEINQPLAAILSNAQAARRFLAAGPPDLKEIHDILDDIIQDDKRAGSVIHRLRLMLQKGKHEAETFNVNDAVRDVVQFLHSEILGRNAALTTDLAPGLPPVHAGRVEVQQVMINLLLNALDALQDVPAESRRILVRTSVEEDAVVVAVRDRGCGIHTQDLSGVFEPFFTTKPAGLGMGLAICRRIVQAYGGRIWAASNEDTGATVAFSLPCAQASRESREASCSAS